MFKRFLFSIIITSIVVINNIHAQLIVTSGAGTTPQQIVQNTLLGTGVTVSNVKFNGSTGPLGRKYDGNF